MDPILDYEYGLLFDVNDEAHVVVGILPLLDLKVQNDVYTDGDHDHAIVHVYVDHGDHDVYGDVCDQHQHLSQL